MDKLIDRIKAKVFPCKNELSKLRITNKELEEKLIEKQAHIDKTNSYWKKKLYQASIKGGNKNS